MSNMEIATTRKPETIANEIIRLSNRMLEDAIEVGRRFVELKAACPHGEWGKWLKYTGYKHSSANNMMRLFESYGSEELSLFGNVKSQTFGKIGYSKALALLAVPEEEREEFAEAVDAESLSVRELKAKIKELEEQKTQEANRAEGYRLKAEGAAKARTDAALAKEAADEMEKELKLSQGVADGLRAEKAELAERVKELEKRPVEVAVQTVDASAEQIAEAVEKAKSEAEEELSKLRKQLEDANKKAEGASPDKIRNERILGEINNSFGLLQTTTNAMLEKAALLDEVTAQKIKAMLKRTLQQMAEGVK